MQDLLRIVTAGSVDDGKSTLLGRILADTGQVPEDQLAFALEESKRRGHSELDPSLLLDGLEDERAQGITIDVAYRYFATEKRSFVLADAPGHARYTRNMATGAAGCSVALLLVDAKRGVGSQTRRHAYVAALMGVRHIVVAVNKMDQINWSQSIFESIQEEVSDLLARLDINDVSFVPVSALSGANVVKPDSNLSWFQGSSLLKRLETMHVASDQNLVDLRFPVQLVLPLVEGERYLSGTLASGVLRVNEELMVLPSGERARVTKLNGPKGPINEAIAGQAISITLDKDLDIARGDVLVYPGNTPRVGQTLDATVVWMDEAPLAVERKYMLRLGMKWVSASVQKIEYKLDVDTGHRAPASELQLNDIARVQIQLDTPVVYDEFRRVRDLGSFILVDRDTHTTAASGVVIDRGSSDEKPSQSNDIQVVWMGASDHQRDQAAQLVASLAAQSRSAIRLDQELLSGIVGDPASTSGQERTLRLAQLLARSGQVPIVLIDGEISSPDGVLAAQTLSAQEILLKL